MDAPRSTLHALRRWLGWERNGAGRYPLASLLQLSDDAILVVDPHTGQIVEANARAAELTGRALADLRQLWLNDLFAQTVPQSLLSQLAPGESRSFRNVSLRRAATGDRRSEIGGMDSPTSVVRVDVRLGLLTPDGPAAVVVRDLTASRRLEQALARVDDQLSTVAALLALATGPVLTPDDDLKRALNLVATICSADAVALYLNDGRQTTGPEPAKDRPSFTVVPLRTAVGLASMLPATCELQADDSVGYRPSPTWSESLQAIGWSAWQTIAVDGGCLFIGQRSPSASRGDAALMNYTPTPALLSLITQIISTLLARMDQESAQAEQAAQRHDAEALSRTLLDQVADGILVLSEDGVVCACNRVAARILGYEPHELAGQPVGGVLIARQDLSDVIACALAGTSSGARQEVTLLSRNAREAPVMLGGAPLPGPGGGALIMLQDLSDRRAQEDERRDLDRLAFLGEMSAIFAHEIRNPLAAISTGVQYIAGKLPPDDPLQDSIALILAESRRLNQLLADILVVARASEPRLAPCPLPEVLDDVLARRAGEMDRLGIQVIRSYAPNLPPCLGDRSKLEQVFTNLIANAIQAMSGGGTLSIAIKEVEAQSPAGGAQPISAASPLLQIEVADTGPGIAEAVQRRIFDPFFTTRRTGTGLGLTIAKRIVGQHNGSLSLRSWEGVGTIFTVTLPAVEMNDGR